MEDLRANDEGPAVAAGATETTTSAEGAAAGFHGGAYMAAEDDLLVVSVNKSLCRRNSTTGDDSSGSQDCSNCSVSASSNSSSTTTTTETTGNKAPSYVVHQDSCSSEEASASSCSNTSTRFGFFEQSSSTTVVDDDHVWKSSKSRVSSDSCIEGNNVLVNNGNRKGPTDNSSSAVDSCNVTVVSACKDSSRSSASHSTASLSESKRSSNSTNDATNSSTSSSSTLNDALTPPLLRFRIRCTPFHPIVTLPSTATYAQLRAAVATATQMEHLGREDEFQLLTGFPPRAIEATGESDVSISALGLIDGDVITPQHRAAAGQQAAASTTTTPKCRSSKQQQNKSSTTAAAPASQSGNKSSHRASTGRSTGTRVHTLDSPKSSHSVARLGSSGISNSGRNRLRGSKQFSLGSNEEEVAENLLRLFTDKSNRSAAEVSVRKAFSIALKQRYEETAADERWGAVQGKRFQIINGRPDPSKFTVEFFAPVSGNCVTKRMEVYPALPRWLVQQVLKTVWNSEEERDRNNLRPYYMAQAQPMMFWNVARLFDGDFHSCYLELFPKQEVEKILERKKELSEKAKENQRQAVEAAQLRAARKEAREQKKKVQQQRQTQQHEQQQQYHQVLQEPEKHALATAKSTDTVKNDSMSYKCPLTNSSAVACLPAAGEVEKGRRRGETGIQATSGQAMVSHEEVSTSSTPANFGFLRESLEPTAAVVFIESEAELGSSSASEAAASTMNVAATCTDGQPQLSSAFLLSAPQGGRELKGLLTPGNLVEATKSSHSVEEIVQAGFMRAHNSTQKTSTANKSHSISPIPSAVVTSSLDAAAAAAADSAAAAPTSKCVANVESLDITTATESQVATDARASADSADISKPIRRNDTVFHGAIVSPTAGQQYNCSGAHESNRRVVVMRSERSCSSSHYFQHSEDEEEKINILASQSGQKLERRVTDAAAIAYTRGQTDKFIQEDTKKIADLASSIDAAAVETCSVGISSNPCEASSGIVDSTAITCGLKRAKIKAALGKARKASKQSRMRHQTEMAAHSQEGLVSAAEKLTSAATLAAASTGDEVTMRCN